jgi:hypothetical protein
MHRLDPATGEVTTVLSETGATRVEPNQWMTEAPIVRVLASASCSAERDIAYED